MSKHSILSRALLLALAALLFAGGALAQSRTFFAMDTQMTVSLPDGADAALLDACEAEIARLEALFSVTLPDSEIAALNRDGEAALSDDTEAVLRFALETGALTDGALDVTLYPIVRAWGFTTGDYRVPGDDEIAALLSCVDYRRVTLEAGRAALPEGFMADLGAVAKGYASDRLAALLKQGGVTSALISLGGNVHCVGRKENGSDWRVGIRDPLDASGFVGALAVADRAVITSGSYERHFTGEDGRDYGHIFDPATGRPADSGLISVTVVGARGMQCDALSTALYVMGVERASALLATLKDVGAVLVDGDGQVYVSQNLAAIFTPMGRYAERPIQEIPSP